jgi:DNA-directed RNA polymerase specialized sigma24 family protein
LPDAEFDVVTAYRRLLARLRSRAERLGSKDPESAAQETLKRSLENPQSKSAIQYYFSENPSSGSPHPGWPLDQLLAWLHGVLHFVVREERNRVSYRREVIISGLARPWVDGESALDAADPAPDQLEVLIVKEMQQLLVDCLPQLELEYRTVLGMRASGLKYAEIACRLNVNENTVATWINRGIRTLAHYIRERIEQPVPSTSDRQLRRSQHV